MAEPESTWDVVEVVADRVVAASGRGVTRVGVDGVDGAGKTHLADELAQALIHCGVAVVRVSMDGFHHPPEVRYRRGRDSPDGFFLDSYDLDAFRRSVLDPIGPGGDRRIVPAVYDVHREAPVAPRTERMPDPGVLLVDGIFLHRDELVGRWDLSIFLDVAFEVSIPRGAARGYGDPDPASQANRRYVEGQRRYLTTCRPREQATIVIDNDRFEARRIVTRLD